MIRANGEACENGSPSKSSNTDPNGASLAVAGAALVVLIGAVAFSKRKSAGLGAPVAPAVPVAAAD
jgi:hypothetical protein